MKKSFFKTKGSKVASLAIPTFFLGLAESLAQSSTSANPYDLGTVATGVTSQMPGAKKLVAAICGLIFLAGAVHVILALVNHSQNTKTIVMSYVGAFVVMGAVFSFM
jgi:hypothetical protein